VSVDPPAAGGSAAGPAGAAGAAATATTVHPRDRLLGAMADAVREAGLPGATVAEVVRRARTSRRTFYEHFEDREACFLALFDAYSERLLETVAHAAAGDDPWEQRVDRAMAAYLAALALDAELTRSLLRETPALGPEGARRVQAMGERWAQVLARLVEEASGEPDGPRPLSTEAAIVITGGFRDLALVTLEHGRDPLELRQIGTDLIARITAR
jgi:AcrR family transcriptional regulator